MNNLETNFEETNSNFLLPKYISHMTWKFAW